MNLLTLSDNIVISARNLTKTYRLFDGPGDRIKQFLSLGLRKYHSEFTALNDVSFDIRKGETVGVVGRNGSGKSTLLQLVCGILKPTSGSITVNGRVAALLELGAGFNPEFTGRENVYFQGALMGFSMAQMEERFEAIATFAGIGRFIDQPVRVYSSGMFVRLAFATVIHSDADILMVDEALAVGDESFQRKCFERIEEILDQKKMVIFFVSHNIRQIERICSQVFWLDQGSLRLGGKSNDVCNAYHNEIIKDVHAQQVERSGAYNCTASGEIDVIDISMSHADTSDCVDEVVMHGSAVVSIRFRCHIPVTSLDVIVGFHTADSVYVVSTSSSAVLGQSRDFEVGEHIVECTVPDMVLTPGVYYVRLAFLDGYRRNIWDGHRLHAFRVVADSAVNVMRMPQLSLVDIPFQWSFKDPMSVPKENFQV
ncbi:ABC transporter ATP-binding protein [Pseudothauera rhizosphaerae]|uniref:ABC transporter ATP-binding protein n=1 Tax=Pseudothauera rhizosphaerae TaxID=2565932 RepID=UPI001454E3BD|nr:ABC transporter ATP-binding protein [Pseudothauera rhizosphaerae]